MKYLKTYEDINNIIGIKKGDYVICDEVNDNEISVNYGKFGIFLRNSIGQVVYGYYFRDDDWSSIKYKYGIDFDARDFLVRYDDIPEKFLNYFQGRNGTSTGYRAMDRKEYPWKWNAKKYNL